MTNSTDSANTASLIHDSDCSTHNEPAYPKGECDCSVSHAQAGELTDELRTALIAVLDWVDAVPRDAQFPAMPGFDRDWIDDLLSRSNAAQPNMKDVDVWKQAVDEQLVAIESTADSFHSPAAALAALLDWHISVALDPRVSREAAALVESGKVAQPEVAQPAPMPVAWVRFRSDGDYEGPIMDCDRRMDGRRESGAWTPLYTTLPLSQPDYTLRAYVADLIHCAEFVIRYGEPITTADRNIAERRIDDIRRILASDVVTSQSDNKDKV